ncbi:antitoxin Xre/MbcA/ParS toxin-binding domain-containing protein [Pseudomonas sp. BT76 TE3572]|uniref:antitoxin Xre/MbcA/ParS toxin-binding domain-containing protein n=1 Tax=Pseudomonas sp. BT76 TE3572 TaxID=3349325 RepID=UPI003D1E72F9
MHRLLTSKGACVTKQNLRPAPTERLNRIAAVKHLAEEVFESRESAVIWMSWPNKALGGIAPARYCETERGAKQVRRILKAFEWRAAV